MSTYVTLRTDSFRWCAYWPAWHKCKRSCRNNTALPQQLKCEQRNLVYIIMTIQRIQLQTRTRVRHLIHNEPRSGIAYHSRRQYKIYFTLKMEEAWKSETLVYYYMNMQYLHPEDGGNMDVWMVDILLHNYTASSPWRWRQHGHVKRLYPTI
jgi:hypothetical protein